MLQSALLDMQPPEYTAQQRHRHTEHFIKTLGLVSKHRHRHHQASEHGYSGEATDVASPAQEATDLEPFPDSSASPIPIPAARARQPHSGRETVDSNSPNGSYSPPKEKHSSRKPNRKASFTQEGIAAVYGGSFVMDRIVSLDTFSRRKRAESFRHFLVPRMKDAAGASGPVVPLVTTIYDPDWLDDEQCRQNPYLASFASSIDANSLSEWAAMLPLPLYKSSDAKVELNTLFFKNHPEIDDTSIKLSHIRSVKTKLLDVALEMHIDLSTVALSYVYFEKLFLRKALVRANRKMVAGACLLLATKINDNKEVKLPALLNSLERWLQIPVSDILKAEFWVFCSLEFNLVLQEHEYQPHLDKLLSLLNVADNLQDYLGPKMYAAWKYCQ